SCSGPSGRSFCHARTASASLTMRAATPSSGFSCPAPTLCIACRSCRAGRRSTGAESDIEQATNLARNMVTRWGMSDKLGMVQLAPRENPYLRAPPGYAGEKPYSEETARLVDAEVQRIIHGCHEEALRLLREHREQLDALVQALLARETLGEDDILEVTGLPRAPALKSAPLDTL